MSRRNTGHLRRAEDRFRTDAVDAGIVTFHSFSFGQHYDPERIGFGPLMAINEEHLAPGAGYDEHHHDGVEIVTWVLEGVLEHRDSTGTHGLIHPGVLQRLSAGSGVTHTEVNASSDAPLVFLQMMLRSDHAGAPEYSQAQVAPTAANSIEIHAPARVTVLAPGHHELSGPVLIHVTRGAAMIDHDALESGDEMVIEDPAVRVTVAVPEGGEALAVSSLHAHRHLERELDPNSY